MASKTPTFHYVFSNTNFPTNTQIDVACKELCNVALDIYASNKDDMEVVLQALEIFAFCYIYSGQELLHVTKCDAALQLIPTYKEIITKHEAAVKQAALHHNIKKKIYPFLGLAYLHAVLHKLEDSQEEYTKLNELLKETVAHNFSKKKRML